MTPTLADPETISSKAKSPKETLKRYSGWFFVLPYLILFSLFLLTPLIYGFRLSLYKSELLSLSPPRFIGAGNYAEAFRDPYFWKAMTVTMRMMLLVTPITILTALGIAVGINSLPRKRQTFFRSAFFVPGMLTISVVGIVWRWFYSPEFGVFNAYLGAFGLRPPWLGNPAWATLAIVIMTVWWTVGGPMIILLAGLQNQPEQYLEAAALDGATAFQRFRFISLPLLRPVLLFTIILNVIGAFQIFGQTLLVTKGGPEFGTRTLVQYIYDTAFNNYRMGYASSMSWILFVVIGAFAVIQFRALREK